MKLSKKTQQIAGGIIFLVTILVILDWPYVSHKLFYSASNNNTGLEIDALQSSKATPNILFIAKLNLTAPLTYPETNQESDVQKSLEGGVAHYATTSLPGQEGNAYYVGHSSDFVWSKGKYKTVFADLPNLAIGDEIQITDPQGQLYTYIVAETKVVAPTDLSVLDQPKNKKLLSLQTSYPVGTALKRYIVISELLEN